MKDYTVRKIGITGNIKPTMTQIFEYLLDLSELNPKQSAEFVSNFATNKVMMELIYDKFKNDYKSLHWLHPLYKLEEKK